MPLHTVPLCNFRYAGETVYFGATFKYDTSYKIIKPKEWMLSIENSKEIEKDFSKMFFKPAAVNILKDSKKYLYRRLSEIGGKESLRELKVRYKEINIKNNSIKLEKNNILINLKLSKNLRDYNKELIINSSVCLETKKLGFIKCESIELKRYNIFLNIKKWKIVRNIKNSIVSIEKSIYLLKCWQNQIYKSKMFVISSKKSLLLNLFNGFLLKKIGKAFYKNTAKQFRTINYCDINKFLPVSLRRTNFVSLNKLDAAFQLDRESCRNLSEYQDINILNRFSFKTVNKEITDKKLNRLTDKSIMKNLDLIYMYKDSSKNISKEIIKKIMQRLFGKRMQRISSSLFVYRRFYKKISKINTYTLNRNTFKYILKNLNSMLKRETDRNIYYDNYLQLIRCTETNANKNSGKYLARINIIDVYEQVEKELNVLPIIDILKPSDLFIKNYCNNKQIYTTERNKSIEVIKRWWWLNPTDPRDNLIIPNKDFNYDNSLLNNLNYEYLRFTNHPIGWGENWGIDFNIPAYAVSIEIMLDLVNILIEIWHSNVQAWMCCSGKESMQFVMELLYDWYTLGTSKPNMDYYRSYRWIRWETEKVYFLDMKNGLQAVGILISNLIDYLKQHHFNVVPIWRNPKNMDIERNFNKKASNGDLIKSLDKMKGKRYYFIDTQNTEKKNIIGR
ncbi:hypothetical protein [Clostridium ljungdahlii]|uniref:Uncharacterized protein n=1 Tax=Clostridium ljungdahlii TaxID=1538 RepID=A0A170NKR2_9CLOT|nr:hypothetical protein [Clostridium ljungdahlii]OAA91270.1 hypothetical protein WY13_00835 [Clostridium ljungdahlii]